VRNSPGITLRAVTCDGQLVGSIASFVSGGETEITYWIDRRAWGRGIASRALALFLGQVPVRPLHARAASDNAGSLRVLQKAGFEIIGTEKSFAPHEAPKSRKPSSGCAEAGWPGGARSSPEPPAKRPLIHNGRSGLMTTPRNGWLRGSRTIPDGPAYPD
jgi:hypothetical protein